MMGTFAGALAGAALAAWLLHARSPLTLSHCESSTVFPHSLVLGFLLLRVLGGRVRLDALTLDVVLRNVLGEGLVRLRVPGSWRERELVPQYLAKMQRRRQGGGGEWAGDAASG